MTGVGAGIAIVALFLACAGAMVARVLPALLAVPLMALGTAALAGASPTQLAAVATEGSTKLALVVVTVVAGAWLGRVALATGIAETIVAYAAEFGGESPAALAFTLCGAVAILFTALTGLGAIVMVGSIVLPIMMTVGVPRALAATSFLLAYALGYVLNVAQWTFYATTFGIGREALGPYALALVGLQGAALVVFLAVRFRRERGYATWALAPEPLERARAPVLALLAPVLPLVLYFACGVPPLVGFALAALYAAALARPRAIVSTLVASAVRGAEDAAPAMLLFFGIGMLLAATSLPQVRAALAPIVAACAPRSPLAYVVLFGAASPLALYRGPLNPFGVGIAVYTVLAGLGTLPPALLVAAIMAVVQVQNACDPTNTQNVWVANFTGVRVEEIARLLLPTQVAVATAAACVAVLFAPRLFGVPAFAAARPAAAAGAAAESASANVLAIGDDGSPLAAVAARAALRNLADDPTGLLVRPLADDPTASDCATKPYAAVLRTSVRIEPGAGGERWTDVGLALADCAGFPVTEWHETRTLLREPTARDVAEDALGLVLRFRTWRRAEPVLASTLLRCGIAPPADDRPTFLYTIFKTVDGNMRAFVRAGGPAWEAGLRTNDVIERIDGKYWWEYGTFATERTPYDGRPHTLEVERGPRRSRSRFALRAPLDSRALRDCAAG